MAGAEIFQTSIATLFRDYCVSMGHKISWNMAKSDEVFPQKGTIKFHDQAPTAYVTFQEYPAEDGGALRFSKPSLDVTLTDQKVNGAVPVYVVPYAPNSTLGVLLPEGQDPAYAVTAPMDGCTLSVSGDPKSPLVSHNNVQETPEFSKSAMLSVRLEMLEVVARSHFQAQLGGQRPNLGANPARLEVFKDPQKVGIKHVNYFKDTILAAGNTLGGHMESGISIQTQTHRLTTTEIILTPDKRNVKNLFSNDWMAPLTMIGERRGGVWRFYHQQHTRICFDAWKVTRVRGINKEVSREQIQSNYRCDVILNRGELWPQQTSTPEAF
jgi:hypothetical protein